MVMLTPVSSAFANQIVTLAPVAITSVFNNVTNVITITVEVVEVFAKEVLKKCL